MTRLFSLSALVVAGALALAACGSSSTSSTSTTSTTSAASTTKPPAATAALVTTRNGPLGTYLVDAKGRALYLWEADKSTKSACNGACAQAWPPLKATGTAKASGGVKMSLLGTSKRADGSTEVTYAGHPLYYFAGDSSAGQTTGEGNEGFGAYWWVVTPSGKAIVHGS